VIVVFDGGNFPNEPVVELPLADVFLGLAALSEERDGIV
jgi:hypothetical protein